MLSNVVTLDTGEEAQRAKSTVHGSGIYHVSALAAPIRDWKAACANLLFLSPSHAEMSSLNVVLVEHEEAPLANS